MCGSEIDFADDTYRQLRGRKAKWLREDFCGTAKYVLRVGRRRRTNHVIGVDLDADVQQWGYEHHIAELTAKAQKRIKLINANVMDVSCAPVDIVLAMNFSYWIFKPGNYYDSTSATSTTDFWMAASSCSMPSGAQMRTGKCANARS